MRIAPLMRNTSQSAPSKTVSNDSGQTSRLRGYLGRPEAPVKVPSIETSQRNQHQAERNREGVERRAHQAQAKLATW